MLSAGAFLEAAEAAEAGFFTPLAVAEPAVAGFFKGLPLEAVVEVVKGLRLAIGDALDVVVAGRVEAVRAAVEAVPAVALVADLAAVVEAVAAVRVVVGRDEATGALVVVGAGLPFRRVDEAVGLGAVGVGLVAVLAGEAVIGFFLSSVGVAVADLVVVGRVESGALGAVAGRVVAVLGAVLGRVVAGLGAAGFAVVVLDAVGAGLGFGAEAAADDGLDDVNGTAGFLVAGALETPVEAGALLAVGAGLAAVGLAAVGLVAAEVGLAGGAVFAAVLEAKGALEAKGFLVPAGLAGAAFLALEAAAAVAATAVVAAAAETAAMTAAVLSSSLATSAGMTGSSVNLTGSSTGTLISSGSGTCFLVSSS